MADTAFQTQYRAEFVAGFEQKQSLLRDTTTTEFDRVEGNTVVFLVADSGGATAQTRGVNGLIPARADNNTQNSCSLNEWHDLVRKTSFNIFASQGNQRQIMQVSTMGVVNRKVDSDIITALATTTVAFTTGVPGIDDVQRGQVKLQNASVPWDSNITLLANPSFISYLEQAPEFSKATYVDMRPYGGGDTNSNWRDMPFAYRWKNMLVISHPGLPGKGTSAEVNFMFHKSAIGHAADTSSMKSAVGYNEEQDYSFARCSIFMGAKLLQASGVVAITADGSARA